MENCWENDKNVWTPVAAIPETDCVLQELIVARTDFISEPNWSGGKSLRKGATSSCSSRVGGIYATLFSMQAENYRDYPDQD